MRRTKDTGPRFAIFFTINATDSALPCCSTADTPFSCCNDADAAVLWRHAANYVAPECDTANKSFSSTLATALRQREGCWSAVALALGMGAESGLVWTERALMWWLGDGRCPYGLSFDDLLIKKLRKSEMFLFNNNNKKNVNM